MVARMVPEIMKNHSIDFEDWNIYKNRKAPYILANGAFESII